MRSVYADSFGQTDKNCEYGQFWATFGQPHGLTPCLKTYVPNLYVPGNTVHNAKTSKTFASEKK